jgi:hypothetical protein
MKTEKRTNYRKGMILETTPTPYVAIHRGFQIILVEKSSLDCRIVGCSNEKYCDREMWKALVLEPTHEAFLDYFYRVCVVPTYWTIVYYPEEIQDE